MTKSFRDLIVWQKSRDLAVLVYEVTKQFPQSEQYGLTSQMRRAAISISSNIAEGYNRFHTREKKQFFAIAYGSGAELESQVEIAKVLFSDIDCQKIEDLLEEVLRILNSFLNNTHQN